MQSKVYYQNKLAQLQTKSNTNLQKFINSAFEMVENATDINERIREIQDLLKAEETKVEEVKEEPAPQ